MISVESEGIRPGTLARSVDHRQARVRVTKLAQRQPDFSEILATFAGDAIGRAGQHHDTTRRTGDDRIAVLDGDVVNLGSLAGVVMAHLERRQ